MSACMGNKKIKSKSGTQHGPFCEENSKKSNFKQQKEKI